MEGEETAGVVRALLLEEFGIDASQDIDLIESGRLDSLDIVRLLATIEDRFGISIELADVELTDIGTAKGLAGLIERCS